MFQQSVNLTPALGVPGQFWGANPKATVIAGEGALVAGPEGLYIGRFAWKASDGLLYNRGNGAPLGFVAHEQQAVITTFLAETSMWIPPGSPVTLYRVADFLAKNDGITASAEGDVIYADQATGKVAAAVGGTSMAASFTASIAANIAASTCSISTNTGTASIAATVMTVGAISTGAYAPGQTLTGTNVAAGTTIVNQLTGTAGSTGTYTVSIDQTVGSTTITGSGGCFTVVSMTSGLVSVGNTLSGGSTTSGNTVLANITGAGGAGKYWVSVGDTISSQAITVSGGTMTVTAVASGGIYVGETIVGGTTGSYVTRNATTPAGSNVTGTGGTGTYKVSVGETVGSTTITIVGNVATQWYARNVAAVGELIKISAY